MEQKPGPLDALDIALDVVGAVGEYYGAYSMRTPSDDRPSDQRPFWQIPRHELNQTPPRRWEAMPIRLLERTTDLPSPLRERLGEMLAKVGSHWSQLTDLEHARCVLSTVITNLRAVRAAAADVLQQPVLPRLPRKETTIHSANLNQGTAKAAAAVAERLSKSDEDTLRYKLTIGALGKVFIAPGIQMPYQAVGYYLYRELELEDETRHKIRTIVEVAGFSNGGVPEAMAADMVKNLCFNPESVAMLDAYADSTVEYEKNEE